MRVIPCGTLAAAAELEASGRRADSRADTESGTDEHARRQIAAHVAGQPGHP